MQRKEKHHGKVALLAEGVDRNVVLVQVDHVAAVSPSSRRAWIEIQLSSDAREGGKVALLAEGVDRNLFPLCYSRGANESPSSRRAWIEISRPCGHR